MFLIKKANEYFNSGKYAEAISVYEEFSKKYPSMKHICEYNLNFSKRKIKLDSENVKIEHNDINVGPKIYIDELYDEVAADISKIASYEIFDGPLVSVVMTSFNAEDYLSEAIISILRQTYSNIELIIVDDCSSDSTHQILERFKNLSPKIKYKLLNANLGTYFAKNIAIQMSKGEYIFFQDSDDISHPERIKRSMVELIKPEIVCIRSCYSRVAYPDGIVLPVNGLKKKLGLITLGVKKKIFNEIGYFNCTSKASDDEFFNRTRKKYSKKNMMDISLPLYYNTFRKGSLFADMVANDPFLTNSIEQKPSESRSNYAAAFNKLHAENNIDKYKEIFKFPVLRDILPVSNDMTLLANPKIPVIVNVCSIPERKDGLMRIVNDMVGQADILNVYLDKYEFVPDFLNRTDITVNVYKSQDYPGLRDNAKFIAFPLLKEECYYITIDDDIIYPADYVQAMIKKIEYYDRRAVIGLHGVLLPDCPTGYFSSFRMVYTFWKKLESDKLVNNLGTGTVAFYSGTLKELNRDDFKHAGMLDVYLSIYCKTNNIPMVAISRPDLWVSEIKFGKEAPTLFNQFKNSDNIQADLIVKNSPWGYVAIQSAIDGVVSSCNNKTVIDRFSKLKPLMHQCLK